MDGLNINIVSVENELEMMSQLSRNSMLSNSQELTDFHASKNSLLVSQST